ncbi:MAG: hypothetical protein HYZ14_07545 [Bacteroidetes bacterium]|nr:hypothetical protein [Bacteroidota bacterium]
MEMIKKIALRILLLIAIVAVSNVIYRHTTYHADLRAESNVLLKFERAVETADALYFSASPNAAVFKDDTDKRTIAQMMDDLLPDLKLEAVDTGGIHAGVFKKLIALIPEDSDVRYVVVNMNYRSFGIGWIESVLENPIQKQLVFYNNRPPIINRFLQGLNFYDTRSAKEREELIQWHWKNDSLPFAAPRNNVTDWCALEKWGDWTNPKRQLADSYIKNFAFPITEENPRLKDFDEIVSICHQKGLKLIFVILPENLQEAEKLVGPELTSLMISNKNKLVNRYKTNEVTVIDCFGAVPDSCFTERIFPSEHYTQTGRMTVARAVTDCINR